MNMKKNFRCIAIVTFLIIVLAIGGAYFAAEKWVAIDSQTKLWSNFWTVFNNLVLLATLLVVAYYTYETYNLRLAAENSHSLSFRPILVFNASDEYYTVTNKGNGAAFNSCLIIWDGNKFKITSDSTVPGVMPPLEKYHFSDHVDIDSAGIKKKIPEFDSLTNRITNNNHPLFCLVYRDLVGNKFYSIINGTGAKYDGVFEHGEVA
jgi:hypothetical protein